MATYENAFLIYNPRAGKFKRRGEVLLQRTIDTLLRDGHKVTAIPTTGPATAQAIARDCIVKGADLILAAGGDGTINEVANGMVNSDVPLGVLPGGTANVLAIEIGLGKGMVKAARRLSTCAPERIATGRIENALASRYFLMMMGAGLDAQIVYSVNAALKDRVGKAAYWLGGFGQIGRKLPEFSVRVNGQAYTCSFALASRVRNYGGDLCIARGASLYSEHFEVVLFQGKRSLPYLKYLFGVVTNCLSRLRGVSVIQADSLELECATDPSIYVQVDGEFAGRLPARIEIVPRSLTLLVPPR